MSLALVFPPLHIFHLFHALHPLQSSRGLRVSYHLPLFMSLFKPAWPGRPQFRDQPWCPLSRDVWEYATCLECSRFIDIHARDRVLNIRDR